MATYRINVCVVQASGSQSWLVEAATEEEALAKHARGESTLEHEEIEVGRVRVDGVEIDE